MTLRFVVSIRRAALSRRHRTHLAELTGIDVPRMERWVLHQIEGATLIPISHLAEDLNVDLPPLSRACRRLEGEGLLVRVPDPRDRRRTLVGLTDHAAESMQQWDAAWPRPYLDAVRGYSSLRLRALEAWMRMVSDAWFSAFGTGQLRLQVPAGGDSAAIEARFEAALRDFVAVAGRTDDLPTVAPTMVRDGEEARIGSGALALLAAVGESPGSRVSDLATREDLDPSLARRHLKSLEAMGLVASRQSPRGPVPMPSSPADVTSFGVTPAGRTVLHRVTEQRLAAIPAPPSQLLTAGLHRDLHGLMSGVGGAELAGPSAAVRGHKPHVLPGEPVR